MSDPLIWLPRGVEIHTRYRTCLRVKTAEEADSLLDDMAEDFAQRESVTFFEAREQERRNIGYWLHTFCSREEFQRVARLFHAESPIFGIDFDPPARHAFWAGVRITRELWRDRDMRPEEIAEMEFHTADVWYWKNKR